MKTTTLTSLAILKVNIDERDADYLEYLASFVIDVLNKHDPEQVTEEITSEFLRNDYGLNVPRKGAQLVLRRLARKGYLKKEHGVFFITKKLPKIDLSNKKKQVSNNIEAICKAIIEFASSEKSLAWNEENATGALLGFFEQFGIDYLRAYVFRTALPAVKTNRIEHYLIANFISRQYEAGSDLFESLILLLKGHMLANALVCPDLESIQKNFHKVTFYFDTPIILSLFGLQGEAEKEAADELVTLLFNLKGTVAIFEHTLDEVRGVIQAAENNIDNPNAEGAVIREIRKSGAKKSDLILLRENAENNLRQLGIIVKATPKYENKYQIGELELQNSLQQRVRYKKPKALDHDVNSIRSIYVLRRGAIPRRLEDCIAVFTTPNSALASAAFEIGKNHNSTREVSAAITDYSLANIAWLKAPLGAPDLPKKELLAACYAAMEPDDELWSKYLREIDALKEKGEITSDDHAMLRVSPLASKELMNLTLGNDADLNGTTIREILSRVKSDLTKEKDWELEQQKRKEKEIARERDKLLEKIRAREARLFWISSTLSKYITYFIEIVVFLVLIGAAFSSTLLTMTYVAGSATLTRLLNGLFLFGVIWGLLNWYLGVSVKGLSSKLQGILQRKVLRILKMIAEPTSNEKS